MGKLKDKTIKDFEETNKEELKKAFKLVIAYYKLKAEEDRPRAKMTMYSVENHDLYIQEYLEIHLSEL